MTSSDAETDSKAIIIIIIFFLATNQWRTNLVSRSVHEELLEFVQGFVDSRSPSPLQQRLVALYGNKIYK